MTPPRRSFATSRAAGLLVLAALAGVALPVPATAQTATIQTRGTNRATA
jgi:hypothetical protein